MIVNWLEATWRKNGIEFRSFPRTGQGERASEAYVRVSPYFVGTTHSFYPQGHDVAYETFLKTS